MKILPAPEARTRNIQTLLEQERATPEDKVVTQLIPLRFADPEEVKRLLTPLVSKNSVILGYAPANTLIITDVQSNIQRLMKILKQIDVPGSGQQISVIPLQYADAARLATQVLNNLFKPTGAPRPQGAPIEKQPVIVADERTSTIVVLASEADTMRIKQLIALLDRETPRGKGKINVYYCEHANAEDLAKVLQEIPSQQAGTGVVSGAGAVAAGGVGGGATVSRGPDGGRHGQGPDQRRQGHQQPDHHGRQGGLRDRRGRHPQARHPALHGLHRVAHHGGERDQEHGPRHPVAALRPHRRQQQQRPLRRRLQSGRAGS